MSVNYFCLKGSGFALQADLYTKGLIEKTFIFIYKINKMTIPDSKKEECCAAIRGVELTDRNPCWQEEVCLQDPRCAFEKRVDANGDAVQNEYGVNVPWCYIKPTSGTSTGEVLLLLTVLILLASLLYLERMKEGNNVLILLTK